VFCFSSLPVDTAVHCRCLLMRRMRMKILLLMLVQLLQLNVPFHLCGGGRGTRRRWRRSGGVEAGPRRLRLGGRRRRRGDGRGRRLRCTLFDVVVFTQDAIIVQVKPIADAEPGTQCNRVTRFPSHLSRQRITIQSVKP